ncbi:MAG: outer membrane lipoprotein carrier protein LolA [Pyrinomonadaceae bacterium]|nr:outer membrane lipoprotein carrier protein LolA [Pyrinomonadaceae bacterium]MBP6212090.1 outer membrane lipoprotein carrier protein LolA [Pyrinomonadaceae bacterium]
MEIKNKLVRTGMTAVFMAVVFGAFSVGSVHAQGGVLKTILDRLDAHYKGLSSLESDVTLVKYNSQIEKSDTSVGTTNYLPKTPKRAMYVRIDWTKPVNESIVVIGESYKMYRPALKQVITGKSSGSKNAKVPGNALAFLSMSKAQLQANYTVTYIGEEQIQGGGKTWHILMTPKTATSYKTAELWVDGDGMPRQAKINENNGDTTTILLSNIQKNITISAEKFKLSYPSDTKEVKG